uniref:Cadherin EGF LAG seven-pass G-type receptor 3 n=1 Tax=Leptobrachium leishanense TaxID=445787 RepID=A0A8C5N1A1_9ANUR
MAALLLGTSLACHLLLSIPLFTGSLGEQAGSWGSPAKDSQGAPIPELPPHSQGAPIPELPPHSQGAPIPELPPHSQGAPIPELPPHSQGAPIPELPPHSQGAPIPQLPPHSQGAPIPQLPPHSQGAPIPELPPHSQGAPIPELPPHSQGAPIPELPPHSQGAPIPELPPHSQGLPSQSSHPTARGLPSQSSHPTARGLHPQLPPHSQGAPIPQLPPHSQGAPIPELPPHSQGAPIPELPPHSQGAPIPQLPPHSQGAPIPQLPPHSQGAPIPELPPHSQGAPIPQLPPHSQGAPIPELPPHSQGAPIPQLPPHSQGAPIPELPPHSQGAPIPQLPPHSQGAPIPELPPHSQGAPIPELPPHSQGAPIPQLLPHSQGAPIPELPPHSQGAPIPELPPHSQGAPIPELPPHSQGAPIPQLLPHSQGAPIPELPPHSQGAPIPQPPPHSHGAPTPELPSDIKGISTPELPSDIQGVGGLRCMEKAIDSCCPGSLVSPPWNAPLWTGVWGPSARPLASAALRVMLICMKRTELPSDWTWTTCHQNSSNGRQRAAGIGCVCVPGLVPPLCAWPMEGRDIKGCGGPFLPLRITKCQGPTRTGRHRLKIHIEDLVLQRGRRSLTSGRPQNLHLEADVRQNPRLEANVRQNPRLEADVRQNPRLEADVRQNPRLEANVRQNPRLEGNVRQNPRLEANVRQNPHLEANVRQNPRLAADVRQNPRLEADVRQNPRLVADVRQNPRLAADVRQNPRLAADVRQNPRLAADVRLDCGRCREYFKKRLYNPTCSSVFLVLQLDSSVLRHNETSDSHMAARLTLPVLCPGRGGKDGGPGTPHSGAALCQPGGKEASKSPFCLFRKWTTCPVYFWSHGAQLEGVRSDAFQVKKRWLKNCPHVPLCEVTAPHLDLQKGETWPRLLQEIHHFMNQSADSAVGLDRTCSQWRTDGWWPLGAPFFCLHTWGWGVSACNTSCGRGLEEVLQSLVAGCPQAGGDAWRAEVSAPDHRTAPGAHLTDPELSERRLPIKLPCSAYFPFISTKGCWKTALSPSKTTGQRPAGSHQQSAESKATRLDPARISQDLTQESGGRKGKREFLPIIRARRATNRHPHFPQYNYQAQVAENDPPGTPVITVTAQDPDMGDTGSLLYSMDALMNSKSLELFSIDSATGLISTIESLDRESMERHYFRVTAVDNGSPRLSATTMVAITVTDMNDHSPTFEQAEYKESIRENVEEGYPILQLRATDMDSQANANIKYRFVNEQAAHSVFEIDARSGLITTSGLVDREKREKYSLIVEASDQGKDPGPRSSTVKVEIIVLDENDNVPQFSEKRYIVQVREDIRPHTEILRVTATDLDKDGNAVVHYNLISGNSRGQFSIDSVTGEIQLVAPLDFETEREYTLRVRAQDAGRPPLSNNTGLISIQVMDVNDHAPLFVSTPFQINVLENVPLGHSVIHIQAVDADSGENARMEYKLTGVLPDSPFVINSASGWITVSGSLDRETVEHYVFGVEARDHGGPSLTATASVTINILDVNDNRPEFTQREYFIRLNEDAAVGTSVLSITAIDRDVNSVITYQITAGNVRNRFSITSQGGSGLITLSLPLDYKQERRYVLTVTASDRILHDNCYVHINITDANTHRPVFQSAHYPVDINEDRPVGSTVVIISATDDDVGENARITYSLEDVIPQFRINPNTGAITLQVPLDYEDQMTYTLAVVAKDNGIPQKYDTTYIEIMVNDVNDNAPQFMNPQYHGIVSEDAPPFTSVLQISATDRDSHVNGRVQYTFQNGEDGDGDFTIEPTSGIIRTVRKLDRESVPFYELTAYAVDRGIPPQRSPVRIQVAVQDVNDNAPVFPADEFEVFIKENSIVGSVVGKIKATDPDEGPNAQIMYQIVEGNIPEIFQMDFFSGELTALIDLDYETKAEYVIVVQATSAPLVSRATVHIRLIDQNDNSPVLKNFQILFNNYISNSSNSFPSGVIGKIPAYDPDVSDRLFYTFERGNELNLLIVNHSSGELRLSRKLDNNRPLVASMLVTVSDGIHSVTAQCVLRVLIITEDMLSNSITVRLENMSQERFLSPLLTSFLEGVSTVLATPKEDIFIFNIQNDKDVDGSILNVSFSALLPSGDRSQFFSSEDLQEQLYMKRMTLTSASMLEVLPFDDNVCLREPCENYMKCISVLKFDSSAPFIASESILFRPIHPITGLRCRCPQGFTGDYCETEINLCYSNPCQNKGLCVRREGGYTCICQERFTGDHCEVDSGSGRCVPGACRNGGTCTNLAGGGFTCQCPSGGFEKPFCELSTRSFPPKSFLMFRGLRQRFHMSLSLSFATKERNGLLFYNGRLNEKHDFIAVEINDGQVQLKYSTGESSTLVTPYIAGGVSDGNWHTIQLRYYNKPKTGSLGVAQGPSKEKVAVLAVDDCDMSVALKFGGDVRNYSCAAEGVQSSSKKSLDLTGPLLLGGVPNLPENFPVGHREFIGCMRDLYIDSKKIDLASYIANNGTSAGCHAKHSFCDSNPCKNGGNCSVTWGTFSCDCPVGFGGKDCRIAMHHPHHFNGSSVLSWDFKNEVKISIPWFLGLAFRTREANGVLLQAHAGQYTTILCKLVSGLVSFSVSRGTSQTSTLLMDQMMVNDGRWHDLQLELRDLRSGRETRYVITINLDYGFYQDSVPVGNELHGLRVKHLHIGGIPGAQEQQSGLQGCIQGVRLGETPSGITLAKPSNSANVKTGCGLPNPCDSNPCQGNSSCVARGSGHTCVCHPGFYGDACADVCLLKPCENKGVCRHRPDMPQGYMCECGERHYGQYCEHRTDPQCPRGWWGNPNCGPCHCDVNKGFDSDCNKTNGQCHCKEYHYRPKGSDTCLPCDCYPVGSSSRSCDPDSGQCYCRPGVIGRQCNSCDNPFAEVSPSGCEVIYDGCPKTLTVGVWWPRTKFSLPAAVPCPKGSLGAAIRHCDDVKGWLQPDLFNCTSPAFMELSALLDNFERNETELNTIEAKKLALRLRSVTDQMEQYFGNDVHITFRLLSLLMQFENRQEGFGLTATQDAHFTENLLRSASSVLTSANKEHWKSLLHNEQGSWRLMELLQEYSSTLARNMKLTYLNPVGLVTPNIMLNIERADSQVPARMHFPRYQSNLFRGQSLWDPHTHVELPASVTVPPKPEAQPTASPTPPTDANTTAAGIPAPKRSVPEPPPTFIILIVYRTLGDLLPARYNMERRTFRLPRNPVMNSPIVTVSIVRDQSFIRGVLDAPLILEFRLLVTVNRSKPICVQWNQSAHSEPPGSWTARDCDLVYRNSTHVRCQCSQFGSFGVLMDGSHREQLEGDLETLAIVTYTSLSISLAALLATFCILTFLKGLKSNTRGIHCNIAIALFLSELLYLSGINRTESEFLCTVIAILLHYFFLSTFAWLFVDGLHIYRMQTEVRNINFGAMRFYYAIGWGVPAIITGLAVGLDPEGYGNPDFCWISIYDKLVWSFAGPIALVIVLNGVMFLMVAKLSCSPGQKETKKKSVLMTLRTSFVLLLCVSTTWLFGLLAVNNSILAFHYLYVILCCFQGLGLLLLFCVFNEEVREAWKLICLGKKGQGEEASRQAQIMGPNAYNNTALFEESGLIRITLGASTVSSVSSVRSARTHSSHRAFLRENLAARQGSALDHSMMSHHSGPTDLDVAMFHRDAGGGDDSDTDSDLSLDEERSLSIPSSESEENVRPRGRFQRPFKRAAHSERLLTNPTNHNPKDVDGNDLMSYWPALADSEGQSNSLQKWGSERKLGLDLNKDAANNNQPDLTSGDENSLTHSHRQRKGILKNRLQYPPGLSSVGRMTNELSWYKTSTLGHRAVPAASYGRMYSGTGSLSQPASRYSSREQLDMLMRKQMSREQLSRNNSRELLEAVPSRHGSREQLDTIPSRHGSKEHLDIVPSRHGSREHLESISSRHGSREHLDNPDFGNETRDRLNSVPKKYSSREHLEMLNSRYGSREQLDPGPEREPSREWVHAMSSRQGSRENIDSLTNRQTSREQLDVLSRKQPSRDQLASARQPSREQLDFLSRRSNSRETLDTVPSTHSLRESAEPLSRRQPSRETLGPLQKRPPSRDNLEPLCRRQPSRENLEAISSRHPSTEQLDILSSILASFNTSVLSSNTNAAQQTAAPSAQGSSTPSALCSSATHSATSHSISEMSADSE